MTQRRILHIFRAPVGGLFRHVRDVVRGQAALGHAVGIFCDASTGGTQAEDAFDELRPHLALGLTRIAMKRMPHPSDAAAIMRLTALYRDTRPDVLHGHGSKGGAYARLATWPAFDGTAIRAYTPHGGSFNYDKGTLGHPIYMASEKILERRTDVYLFESGYVRDRFEQFVGATDKVTRVVHNGIAEREFDPILRAPDPFDLVFIGEFREAKGIDTLFEALAAIRREDGTRPTLLCVGSGPSEGELRTHAATAGILDSITFEAPQPIRPVLARGRVMVVPSRMESLPYVILEAAAGRQPIIATNVGGVGEIFGPYANELIKPSDPKILADRIRAMLAEPEETRADRAAALSRYVSTGFNIDLMVRGGLEGYESAFAARNL